MQRHDPMDELVRRAHERSPGAPAGFAGRLHARVSAEAVSRRRTHVIYIQSAIAVAALIILALTIGLNPQWFAPAQANTEQQPQAKSTPEQPAHNTNTPEQKPEPQGKPDNSAEPEPKKPDVQPEPTPDPTPVPKKPDDPIEPPLPEPEPKKPDDVVEKPEPGEPEDTTPAPDKPAERVLVATLLSADAKLQVRYGIEPWRDWAGGESLYAGVDLRAGRAAIDLTLTGGGVARFDGEISFLAGASGLAFDLGKDSIYIDNLGTGNAVSVTCDGHEVVMPDGVCFVIVEPIDVEAACLEGGLTIDGSTVERGTYRQANKYGVADAKAFKTDGKLKNLLKNLPARLLLREDFDVAPEGGMYQEGERLENGFVVSDKQPGYIAFRYNPTLTVLPGTVLRVRLRATDVSRLELELFTQPDLKLLKRNKEIMFKHTWKPAGSEWQEVEFRLADIAENDNPERKCEPGDLLRNFKLHFTGKKLEIDWVQFVRVQAEK